MTMMKMEPDQQPTRSGTGSRSKLLGCVCFSIFSLFGAVCLGSGLFLYARFDHLFGETVRGQMAIDDADGGNWWYQQWRQSAGRQTLTFHVFEVENAEELRSSWWELAMAGVKNRTVQTVRSAARGRQQQQQQPTRVVARVLPQVREVGPFVFRVERQKEQIHFSGELRQCVSYVQHVRYHFDQLLSYEDLDHRITVINAELASLTPFIRMVAKRARSVKKISQSLRQAIDQMLDHFLQNLFVERPVWRILFGPNHRSNDIDDDAIASKANLAEQSDPEEEYEEEEGEEEQEDDVRSAQNDTFRFDFTTITDDPSVARIMAVYDRIRPYLQRLGVPVNPYRLLHEDYRFEPDGNRLVPSRKRRSSASGSELRKNSVFGLFANNTRERFDAFTGTDQELGRHGQIFRWNHLSDVDAWYGNPCNQVNGTDGHQFETLLKARRIYEFVPRICRSLPMMLTDTDVLSTPGEIYLRRYARAGEFMQSPFRNRKNLCYCRYINDPKRCNYDGILDLSNCYHGAPILLTAPHFSGIITQSIRRSVAGLTPDEEIYRTYTDLEPISGAVLDKAHRFQFNVHLPPMPLRLNATRPLPERIIPLLWYQDQWLAPAEHQSHLKYYFVYPMQYQQYAMMALLALGLLLMAIAFISAFYFCLMKKQDDQPQLIQVIDPVVSSAQQAKQKKMIFDENGRGGQAQTLRQQPQPILQPVRYAIDNGKERNLSVPNSERSVDSRTGDPFAQKINELFPDEYLEAGDGQPEDLLLHNQQRKSLQVRSPPPAPLVRQSTGLSPAAGETNSLPDTDEAPVTSSLRALIAGQMLLNRQRMSRPPSSTLPPQRTDSPRKIFPLIRASGRLPDEKESDYGFFRSPDRTVTVNATGQMTDVATREKEDLTDETDAASNPMMDLGYGDTGAATTKESGNRKQPPDTDDDDDEDEEGEEEETEYPEEEEQDEAYPLDFYQAVPWPVASDVLAEVKLRSRILNSKRRDSSKQ